MRSRIEQLKKNVHAFRFIVGILCLGVWLATSLIIAGICELFIASVIFRCLCAIGVGSVGVYYLGKLVVHIIKNGISDE